MTDNPFSEPQDDDRTIIKGLGKAGQRSAGALPTSESHSSTTPRATSPRDSFSGDSSIKPLSPVDDPTVLDKRARWLRPAKLASEPKDLPRVGASPMLDAAAPLIDLLARIGAGNQVGQVANAAQLRDRASGALKAFENDSRQAAEPEESIRAAHYALCAALDDVVLATAWGRSSGWSAHSLCATFHDDVRAGENFFVELQRLQQQPARYRNALEVFYLCLSLGFKGRYRNISGSADHLSSARDSLYRLLNQLRGPAERELSAHWKGVDAPHRNPGRFIPLWVAGAVALGIIGFGYLLVSYRVNALGDELQGKIARLPPQAPAVIERGMPVVPPKPALASGTDLVDSVRQFLAPEIRDQLVDVQGDAQRLMIRLVGRGLFTSGSAKVAQQYVPVLKRVGEAIQAEPGRINIIGHTDSQPISSGQFQSNWHLSRARADNAMQIIASAGGNPNRYSSTGRADTDPMAPNSTPEQNRRVEVVLLRGQGG